MGWDRMERNGMEWKGMRWDGMAGVMVVALMFLRKRERESSNT